MSEAVDPFGWLKDQGEDAPLLYRAQTAHGRFGSSPDVIGLAVSGGSDSMAMLHLMAKAAPYAGWSLRAVSVDHRLRPEAADEVAFVASVCIGLGVPHDTLVWDHGPEIAGNLMEAARDARYRLLAGWAQSHGIGLVLLAHTADDQAETFLMGLARAAGLDGLTGMRRQWDQQGVTFRRPFMLLERAEMRAYLDRHGKTWMDDPTNDNIRYARTKARRALKALQPLGITVDRLSTVIRNLAVTQAVVRDAVDRAGRELLTELAGGLQFESRPWAVSAPELQRRLLIAMIRWIGGAAHPPREHKLNQLADTLRRRRDATLGGVRFRWQGDRCTVVREGRAADGPKPVGTLWDHRWIVEGPPGEVRALGPKGLPQVKDWHALGLPREILIVTPAVWDGDTLLAAPLAGIENGWKARIATPFRRFLVSH